MKMRIILATTLALVFIQPVAAKDRREKPQELDHYTAITAYTSAFPVAVLAEDACPGMKQNTYKLFQMRVMANISDEEQPMVNAALDKTASGVKDSIKKEGKLGWCSSVWSLFGDRGSVIPGLLTRP